MSVALSPDGVFIIGIMLGLASSACWSRSFMPYTLEAETRQKATAAAFQEGIVMTKATGRLILLVAIVGLIVGLVGVQFFLPISGVTVQLEEAGLIGALIAGLSSVIGYYFGKD